MQNKLILLILFLHKYIILTNNVTKKMDILVLFVKYVNLVIINFLTITVKNVIKHG